MKKLLQHYLYFKLFILYGILGRIYNNLLLPIQLCYYKHKSYRLVFGIVGFIVQLLHTILLELLCNERSSDYFPQIRYPRAAGPCRNKRIIYARDFTLELSLAVYSTIYYLVIKK